MLVFGPISSIFDFLTFYLLFAVFHLKDSMFQTWRFIESLATQVFVIYVIRTRKLPFFQSSPSKYLLASTIGMVALGVICTFPFIGYLFGFSPLPRYVFAWIVWLVSIYLVLVELVKRWFYTKMYNKSDV
jgi:Mg2+-importing ATPase